MKWTEETEQAFKILMFLGMNKISQLQEYVEKNEIINEKRLLVQAQYDLSRAMKNRR